HQPAHLLEAKRVVLAAHGLEAGQERLPVGSGRALVGQLVEAARRRRVGRLAGAAHGRLKSSVQGKARLRVSGGRSTGPGLWPMTKKREARRDSASLALTGKVS